MELPTITVCIYDDAELDDVNRAAYPDLDDHIELGWRWEVTIAFSATYDPQKGDAFRAEAKLVDMHSAASEDEYLTARRFIDDDEYTPEVPDRVAARAKRRAKTVMQHGSQ